MAWSRRRANLVAERRERQLGEAQFRRHALFGRRRRDSRELITGSQWSRLRHQLAQIGEGKTLVADGMRKWHETITACLEPLMLWRE